MPAKLLKPSLDWLLICVPIAMIMRWLVPASPTALFIVACLAVIPLAGWMGKATEHLAEKVGEGIGGLLNATFGNAAELIIALIAIQKGLYGVVKASITGSIIGNILLVLGLSFVMGGAKYPQQRFNRTAARSSATTLLLAAIALMLPTLFHRVADDTGKWTPVLEQRLSLAIAIVLFLTYGATLAFSLVTHKSLFAGGSHGAPDAAELSAAGASTGAVGADVGGAEVSGGGIRARRAVGNEVGEETETPLSQTTTAQELDADEGHGQGWSKAKSIGVLVVATVFVALMSEFLVGSVEAARESLGLTEVFVGVIVVAIIGNAAEHSTAVLMALRNKPDLSLSIALGSSVQIALFVAPVLVFASYAFGRPLDLEFTIPEVAAVIVSVGIVSQIAGDGESNWLEGAQLLAVYAVLGILFFFLPEVAHVAAGAAGH